MLDLVPIWKDRGITKDLKMKLVRSLVWTVLTYGAEGWTLTKADEKRIQSAELWIYRRMLRVSWTEHRTDDSILTELGTTRQLLGFVIRRKLSFAYCGISLLQRSGAKSEDGYDTDTLVPLLLRL